jgi:hypothetical protein
VQREQRRGASPEAFEALGQHLVVGGSRARHLGCNTPNSPISAPLANYGLLCAAINQSNRRLTRSLIIHSVSSVNLFLSLSLSMSVCVDASFSLCSRRREQKRTKKITPAPLKSAQEFWVESSHEMCKSQIGFKSKTHLANDRDWGF